MVLPRRKTTPNQDIIRAYTSSKANYSNILNDNNILAIPHLLAMINLKTGLKNFNSLVLSANKWGRDIRSFLLEQIPCSCEKNWDKTTSVGDTSPLSVMYRVALRVTLYDYKNHGKTLITQIILHSKH